MNHSDLKYIHERQWHLTASERSKMLILSDLLKKKKYGDIIGVELSNTGWSNIDAFGDALDNSRVKQSPCLGNIREVTVDDQEMVEIPKFYFLYQTTDLGQRWWVAPHEFTISGVGAAQVHKSFIYKGIEKAAFQVSQRTTTFEDSAIGHNDFMFRNIWHHAAIQMLSLIDTGHPHISVYQTGEDCVWRGIHDLLSAFEYIPGLQLHDTRTQVIGDAGNAFYSPISFPFPAYASFTRGYHCIWRMSKVAARMGLFFPDVYGGRVDGTHYQWNSYFSCGYESGSVGDEGYLTDIYTGTLNGNRSTLFSIWFKAVPYHCFRKYPMRLARPVSEQEVVA